MSTKPTGGDLADEFEAASIKAAVAERVARLGKPEDRSWYIPPNATLEEELEIRRKTMQELERIELRRHWTAAFAEPSVVADVAAHARLALGHVEEGRAPRSNRRVVRRSPSRGDPDPEPAGSYHAADKCARCGAEQDLYRTLLRATHAEGALCCDPIGCERRRAEGRRLQ